mmetsp:Transcript_4112/g.12358  ORF Transcript_4112/g.12358 Transcript_4112/m.12358 type:complete len:321 (+) Transcript_4112:55-1017(+)
MRGVIVVAALVAAAVACRCIPRTDAEKYNDSDFVLTASVLSETVLPSSKQYKVAVLGILKAQDDPTDYIGKETTIVTSLTSCQIYLQVGEVYVLGGSVVDGEKRVEGCDTVVQLGSECVLPPCPKGCASWFDGCNTHICRDGKVLGTTRKLCSTVEAARCLAPEERCPEDCAKYNFGCDACTCGADNVVDKCDGRVCVTTNEPFCERKRECVICIQVLPTCDEKCRGRCVITPQTCTKCSQAICVHDDEHTYRCDLYSVWNRLEKRFCLRRGRMYTDLCYSVEDCCAKKGYGDHFRNVRRGRRSRRCQRNVCKSLACPRP